MTFSPFTVIPLAASEFAHQFLLKHKSQIEPVIYLMYFSPAWQQYAVSCNLLRHNQIIYCLIISLTILCSCNPGLTKCKQIQEWKIGEFRIVKSDCLGPAGPNYYPFSVYNGKRHLGGNGFQKDSCTITIQPEDDLYMVFNICSNSFSEIKPEKKEIDIKEVDSITMFSNQLKQTKPLSAKQIERFVRDWNNSRASDYRDKHLDSIFFPNYQYKLIVHLRNGQREFLGFNYLINDRTQWTYFISKNEDTNYFNKLWTK